MKHYVKVLAVVLISSGLFWTGVAVGIKYVNKPKKSTANDGRFVIVPNGNADNRPTFTVILDDNRTMDHMYAEEIAQSMIDGQWKYNECLTIEEGN